MLFVLAFPAVHIQFISFEGHEQCVLLYIHHTVNLITEEEEYNLPWRIIPLTSNAPEEGVNSHLQEVFL